MPQPRLPSSGQVLVKLSDFSISRVLSPIGKNLFIDYRLCIKMYFYVGTKGFAGTEGREIFPKGIL